MPVEMAANEIRTHACTNQRRSQESRLQQSFITGQLWVAQPSQPCVDSSMLAYKNANLFIAAMATFLTDDSAMLFYQFCFQVPQPKTPTLWEEFAKLKVI